jgi:uncharacterized protein YukE
MKSIHINENRDELERQLRQVEVSILALECRWEDMKKALRKPYSFWQGDAGDAHRQMAEELGAEITCTLQILKRRQEELMQAAGLGFDEQQEIRQQKPLPDRLPDDVI